jgi:Mg2+ and Co2+ transporter CorA
MDSTSPGDRVTLDQVAQSLHLMSVDGYEWIDFVARPEAVGNILHDGGFVMATRQMLQMHSISPEVVHRVARDVWLPVTHVSSDGASIAVITRVPYSDDDRQGVDAMWADTAAAGQQGSSSGLHRKGEETHSNTGGESDSLSNTSDRGEETAEQSSSGQGGLHRVADMTILGLTVRMNIFIHRPSKKIITVHRFPLKLIVDLQKDWHRRHRFDSIHTLLFRLLHGSVKTFESREGEYTRRLDWLESSLFREDLSTDVVADAPSTTGGFLGRVQSWWARASTGSGDADDLMRYASQPRALSSRILQRDRDRQNLRRAMWWSSLASSSTAKHHHVHMDHKELMSHMQAIHRQASATVRVLREVEGAYRAAAVVLCAPPPPPHNLDSLTKEAKALHQRVLDGCEKDLILVKRRIKSLHAQAQSAIFQWEGLREQSQALLSLQVSVAVSRLEELLRFLTVFTTIFIPLELITGIFGMNFVSMREFGAHDGSQWLAFALMLVTAVWTQRWIRRTSTSVAGL